MHTSKFIGSVLILTGTALGAGMLALPMIAAATGFVWATILLVAVWALMTYTALLILEVNLAFPAYRNNFGSMAYATLGRTGKIAAWVACLALLYALTAAYIAGDASLLAVGVGKAVGWYIPQWLCAILFTVVLGGAVFWSTKAVDHLNRSLISIKGCLLVATLVLLMPHINMATLMRTPGSGKYLWACIPIFICAFGFHTVIPSLSNYIGPKPKTLKWVIICGATIPLLIYILWLLTTLGIVPLRGANSLQTVHGSVGKFVDALVILTHNRWVTTGVNGFSNVAMTTSFLGVTLGLFDFLADLFKIMNNRVGRLRTAILTFVPPLVFALFYPQGFVIALGYAAIFVAILEIIMPVLMVQRLRRSQTLTSPYKVASCKPLLWLIVLAGVIVIITQLFNALHFLPVL